MEKYPSFIKKYPEFSKDIWKSYFEMDEIMRLFLAIIIFTLLFAISVIIIRDLFNIVISELWEFLLLISLFISMFYLSKPISNYLLNKYINNIQNIINSVESLICSIIHNIQFTQDTEEILIKVENIYKLNTELLQIQNRIRSSWQYRKKYEDMIPETYKWLKAILTDLRSDLSIRLSEQQSTLESAKSEVEKNITWTTELESVSELQRARLDRQIEQFEELQRVLVKV